VPAFLSDNFGRTSERGVTRAGRLCLDKTGHGRWTSVSDFPSGRLTCHAPVSAHFGQNGSLDIGRPRVNCDQPGRYWVPAQVACARRDDEHADCISTETQGRSNLEFRRAH
jgi:hypothetical protein